jgi:DNA-binding LacI/PurR family transcriptional regulator
MSSSIPKMTTKRRFTSVDVARASGLSRATVSYVLNNDPRQTIPPETRERVLKAAEKLGYRPSAAARALRSGYSRLILGILQFEQVDPNLARDLHYLEAGLAAREFTLIWHVGTHVVGSLHPSANLAPAVVIAFFHEADSKFAAFLQQFDVPVLSIINMTVREAVGRAQVNYLLEKGKSRIVYAAPERPDVQFLSQTRLSGVQQECARLGLKPPFVQVIPSSRSEARKAINKILNRRALPLGICCYNDEVAFAVLAALSDAGVSVPESVAVIGCDDIPLAQFSQPPLTTIAFDSRQFLDLLIENILAASNGESPAEIPPTALSVITRGSV